VINSLEPSLRALTDAELAEQTLRFRAALERNRHRCVLTRWVCGCMPTSGVCQGSSKGVCAEMLGVHVWF
jgi:hypothetical protein